MVSYLSADSGLWRALEPSLLGLHFSSIKFTYHNPSGKIQRNKLVKVQVHDLAGIGKEKIVHKHSISLLGICTWVAKGCRGR